MMENDKNLGFDPGTKSEDEGYSAETAPRARNRTVMLTPEITGQVRARLAQELGEAPAESTPRVRSAGIRPGGHVVEDPAADSEPGFQRVAPREGTAAAVREAPAMGEGVAWTKESPIIGFLVSFDRNPNGDVFELRSGRLIVSSQPVGNGNCLLIKSEAVSPMHAIMRISKAGEIQVLDQLSEHGTRIKRFGSEREEELAGDKSSVEHGDVLIFGDRTFHICTLAMSSEE